MPNKFETMLKEHTDQEEKKFDGIQETLNKIKENHLAHIEKSMANLDISNTEMKTNLAWLLKFFWIITGSSVSALVIAVFNLIIK